MQTITAETRDRPCLSFLLAHLWHAHNSKGLYAFVLNDCTTTSLWNAATTTSAYSTDKLNPKSSCFLQVKTFKTLYCSLFYFKETNPFEVHNNIYFTGLLFITTETVGSLLGLVSFHRGTLVFLFYHKQNTAKPGMLHSASDFIESQYILSIFYASIDIYCMD